MQAKCLRPFIGMAGTSPAMTGSPFTNICNHFVDKSHRLCNEGYPLGVGRLSRRYSLRRSGCGACGQEDTACPRAARASRPPALRPAGGCSAGCGRGTGGRGARRVRCSRPRNLAWAAPWGWNGFPRGESRSGTPAGERARKPVELAQASEGGSPAAASTDAEVGQAPFGVPLPFCAVLKTWWGKGRARDQTLSAVIGEQNASQMVNRVLTPPLLW